MMSKIQLFPGMRVVVTGERQTNLFCLKHFLKKCHLQPAIQCLIVQCIDFRAILLFIASIAIFENSKHRTKLTNHRETIYLNTCTYLPTVKQIPLLASYFHAFHFLNMEETCFVLHLGQCLLASFYNNNQIYISLYLCLGY